MLRLGVGGLSNIGVRAAQPLRGAQLAEILLVADAVNEALATVDEVRRPVERAPRLHVRARAAAFEG